MPGKFYWRCPNCSGIEPKSDPANFDQNLSGNKLGERDLIEQKNRDTSSPSENGTDVALSSSNSSKNPVLSTKENCCEQSVKVAGRDHKSDIGTFSSSKRSKHRNEHLVVQPGTTDGFTGLSRENEEEGKREEKEFSRNSDKNNQFEEIKKPGYEMVFDAGGSQRVKSSNQDPRNLSFQDKCDAADDAPSQSLINETEITSNAPSKKFFTKGVPDECRNSGSAESPEEFENVGCDYSETSDDCFRSPESVASLNNERKRLDESDYSSSTSLDSTKTSSATNYATPMKTAVECTTEQLSDSDDGSTYIATPRMNSYDDDLEGNQEKMISHEEFESFPLRKAKRRKLSGRAWNPPHPICSLQRLDKIFAEQLKAKKRRKSVKKNRKIENKDLARKARSKTKKRHA
jgi:hypothetical protein